MLVEDLKRFELFCDLDDIEIRRLFQFAKMKRFKKDQIIFGKGSKWAGFLFLLKGDVEVRGTLESGEEGVVDTLGSGEFIGEKTLFGDVTPHQEELVATSDSNLLLNTLEYRRLQNSGPMVLTKILLRLVILLSNEFRTRNAAFGAAKKELEELEPAPEAPEENAS
jgi:CRP-like cAMP-binding protein